MRITFSIYLVLKVSIKSDLLLISGACHVELKEYEKRLSSNGGSILGAYEPDCRDDGYYNVRQCRPSSASCWCVNTRTGQKIPGTEKTTFITNIDCSQYNDGEIQLLHYQLHCS